MDSIRSVVARCTYPGFNFLVGEDDAGKYGVLPYLQIECPEGFDTTTGEPMSWRGRKWKLSFYMTDTELVNTVWAAVQRALLHEACELFKFREVAIFDRHINVHRLVELASGGGSIDARPPRVEGLI